MDVWSSLLDGFATAATPANLLYALVGVLLGTAVGVLPGLGPAMTVALLLPVTFALEPASAFIILIVNPSFAVRQARGICRAQH